MDRVKIRLDKVEDRELLRQLRPSTLVLLTGKIYTARDQAHRRLYEDIKKGKLPINLKGSVIYYCGPTLPKKGWPIGSCGPTTSSRMDKYIDLTLKLRPLAVIGKGERAPDVLSRLSKAGIRYLVAPGGAGAYLASRVRSSRVVLYPELGPEAVYELQVENFPAVVSQ